MSALRALSLALLLALPSLARAQEVREWSARDQAAGTSEQGPEANQAALEGDSSDGDGASAIDADENMADEISAKREKQAKTSVGALGQEIDQNLSDLQELQGAIGRGASSMDLLTNPETRKKLIAAFANNPMSQMPREALKPQLLEQLKKTPWRGLADRSPRFVEFLVDFMHHPRAMSQLVKMLDRTEDLRNCGLISLGLWVVLLLLRRKVVGKKARLLKRLGYQFAFSLAFFAGSLFILWTTFREELGPTAEIFAKNFL